VQVDYFSRCFPPVFPVCNLEFHHAKIHSPPSPPFYCCPSCTPVLTGFFLPSSLSFFSTREFPTEHLRWRKLSPRPFLPLYSDTGSGGAAPPVFPLPFFPRSCSSPGKGWKEMVWQLGPVGGIQTRPSPDPPSPFPSACHGYIV